MRPASILLWLATLFMLPSHGGYFSPKAFQFIGPTNKIITPNGDGKNDTVVFLFNNPLASDVSARIYDIKGRTVAASLPFGPCLSGGAQPNCNGRESREWDAKANGQIVPGGVYIYVIEVEGLVFSGMVVVIR
jgi:hypothetical protein